MPKEGTRKRRWRRRRARWKREHRSACRRCSLWAKAERERPCSPGGSPGLFSAATNRPVQEWAAAEDGRFRGDLLARFQAVVRIPPLRERRQDMKLLISLALQRGTINPEGRITHLSLDALDFLLSLSGLSRQLPRAGIPPRRGSATGQGGGQFLPLPAPSGAVKQRRPGIPEGRSLAEPRAEATQENAILRGHAKGRQLTADQVKRPGARLLLLHSR
jgi:hypothetical protein